MIFYNKKYFEKNRFFMKIYIKKKFSSYNYEYIKHYDRQLNNNMLQFKF